ncbi:MAG TPA: helix-turn-helix domain-containing protein [Bacteroidota bacterium]|nr:helix-turn-helix domain-containing protein [Bacteroidota bacterium]
MTKMKELKIVDGSEFFTIKETAKILGIEPNSIRNYLSWGKITAYKFKSLTLISREEIERWKGLQK